MSFRTSKPTFAGGEISKSVAARYDVAKYDTALTLARNTLGLPTGGQYNRPGLEFVDYTIDETKFSELFTFSFSVDQSYALMFGPNKMRVYYDGGAVLEPQLLITGATKTNPLTVTIPANGWAVGRRVFFSGVTGMTQINGLILTVTGAGDTLTFGGVDATGWGAFVSSGGGLPGSSGGGTGGNPPPPVPGQPDPPPTEYPDIDLEVPPTTGGFGDQPQEIS